MKKKVSLILNLIIAILEIVAIIINLNVNHRVSFEYYTEDSNLLALFSSLLFVIFILGKRKIPKWLQMFKYMTTICLTITFLVVIFVLAPMYDFNYGWFLFHNALLFQHLLCPILCIITFLIFDDISFLKKNSALVGISLSLIYTIVIIILNILEVVKGPYPFLYVYEQSVYMSIMWFFLIQILTFVMALLLKNLYNKIHKISNN